MLMRLLFAPTLVEQTRSDESVITLLHQSHSSAPSAPSRVDRDTLVYSPASPTQIRLNQAEMLAPRPAGQTALTGLTLAVLALSIALSISISRAESETLEGDHAWDSSPAFVGTNADGNLEIKAPTGKDVIINGVSFSSVLDRLVALEGRETAPTQAPSASLAPGVTVIGDSTYVTGKNVYISSPKHVSVNESEGSWTPARVEIGVADTVRWNWFSNESVEEVDREDNTTVVPGGIGSGHSTLNGSFSHQFLREGTFRFRALNKGFLMSVVVGGYGVSAGRNTALDVIAAVKAELDTVTETVGVQATGIKGVNTSVVEARVQVRALNTSLLEVHADLAALNQTQQEPTGPPPPLQLAGVWTHTNTSACAQYVPSSYPASVFVEVGGGGGGGGSGWSNGGSSGGESTVTLLGPNASKTLILTALGGPGGQCGACTGSGPAHGTGQSPLVGAMIRTGAGGAGGIGGVVGLMRGAIRLSWEQVGVVLCVWWTQCSLLCCARAVLRWWCRSFVRCA